MRREPLEQRVLVRVERDLVTVKIDASGEPLHERGWRQQTAKMPLRESVAAAVLQRWSRARAAAERAPHWAERGGQASEGAGAAEKEVGGEEEATRGQKTRVHLPRV